MKKLLVSLTVLFAALGLGAAPAAVGIKDAPVKTPDISVLPSAFDQVIQIEENFNALRKSGGGSSLGTGFKSISGSNTTRSTSSAGTSGGGYYGGGPMFFGFVPIPFMGHGGGVDIVGGIILLLVVGGVIWFFFFRNRNFSSRQDKDETQMLIERCEKNMGILTEEYLKGQQSLEFLQGKVSDAEHKDWENDFAKVNLGALESELKDAKARMKTESIEVVRQRLFSFDEDATQINEFLSDLNERARTLRNSPDLG